MFKIPLIISLAILSGCATQNGLSQVEKEIDTMTVALNTVTIKTNNLSEKQITDKIEIEKKIDALNSDSSHFNDDINATKNVIVDINKTLGMYQQKNRCDFEKTISRKS
ncbi:MAG: hypothetical protein QX189_11395 [Methylococcales bacterium]